MNNRIAGVKFTDDKHQEFYIAMMARVKRNDCYHRAFFYVIGLTDDTRRHIKDLFDFEEDGIKPEGLEKGWQTSGSSRICRMAFNLWGGYVEGGAEAETTPDNLFACSFAPYFVEGLKLRFPENFARGAVHAE